MDAIAFGTRAEADRLTARVRAMHRRVGGSQAEPAARYPAGKPYRGDDPELLLWILACLADSALLVYGKYVRRLASAERDALWRDYRIVGRRFGLAARAMPASAGDLDDYMRDMYASGDLFVSAAARELAVDIVLHPPLPLHLRPLVELVNQVTVGLLPTPVRRLYGFSWDPLRAAALHGGAEYLRRVVVPLTARLRAPVIRGAPADGT
jgi:uncharacterized protein (DUF2236 family)